MLTDPKPLWVECYYATLRAALECQIHLQAAKYDDEAAYSWRCTSVTVLNLFFDTCALSGLHICPDRYLSNFYSVISWSNQKQESKTIEHQDLNPILKHHSLWFSENIRSRLLHLRGNRLCDLPKGFTALVRYRITPTAHCCTAVSHKNRNSHQKPLDALIIPGDETQISLSWQMCLTFPRCRGGRSAPLGGR